MTPLLSIKHLSLSLAANNQPVLSDINLDVYPGDVVVILGGNGSGKSSLLKAIDKRSPVPDNCIFWEGRDINTFTRREYSLKVHTLTQSDRDSLFSSLTLFENYLIMQDKIPKTTVSRSLQADTFREYLRPFSQRLADRVHQPVQSLSGGEKQMLALALIMIEPPKLLLLDEHTSALDPRTAKQTMKLTTELIERHHITCLLTTHNLDLAKQYGNRIVAIQQGCVLANLDASQKNALSHQNMFDMFYESGLGNR